MVSNCSKNVLSERILFKNIYLGFFLSIEGEFLFHGLLSSVQFVWGRDEIKRAALLPGFSLPPYLTPVHHDYSQAVGREWEN